MKILFFLIFQILFYSNIGSAQNTSYVLDKELIDGRHGLVGQRVEYTFEDKRGIIWAITSDGLNRFDGRNVKAFKEFAASDYFRSNHFIIEDSDGWLWVFNNKSGKIIPQPFLINSKSCEIKKINDFIQLPFSLKNISFVHQGDDGKIYFSTRSKEIYVYHGDNKFTELKGIQFEVYLRVINASSNGTIWILIDFTKNGNVKLARVKNEGNTTYFEFKVPKLRNDLNLGFVKQTDSGHSLFYASSITNQKSTYFFSISEDDDIYSEYYKEKEDIPFSTIKKYSKPLSEIENAGVLFSLFSLKIFSSEGDLLCNLDELIPEIKVLKNQKRRKYFYISSSNIIFVNTRKGLLKVHFEKNRFQSPEIKKASQGNSRRILKSANKILFGKLNRQLWDFNNAKAVTDRLISDFFIAPNGNFWTWDSYTLNEISPAGKIINAIPIVPRLTNFVPFGFTLYDIDNDHIYLGCQSKQIIYSRNLDEIIPLEVNIPNLEDHDQLLIYDFQKDSMGNLWVSSNKGLLLADFESRRFSSTWIRNGHEISLPSQDVHHIYQDTLGIFWLAGKNLTRWNSLTNESKTYTIEDGLPSSILHAVYPDDFGNLWLSTENGISRFNFNQEKFNNYFTSDGITHNECNRTSHFQDEDGVIYFGGIDGINIITPTDFQTTNQKLKSKRILITDFEQSIGEEEKVVNKLSDILKNNKITFSPNDRFFRIQFSIPYFFQNDFIKYEYKISGLEEEWIQLIENQLLISTLPYGDFDLKIRAKLASGQYLEDELVVPIYVLKPFYLQGWFLTLAAILFFTSMYALFRYRTNQLKQQKVELQKLVEQRTQIIEAQKVSLEKSNEFKNRLFAIIAHDMRSAVYSFTGLTDTIKTFIKFNKPEKILKMSHAIDKSSYRLRHLLDNLLEWALTQRNQVEYNPKLISIIGLYDTTISQFKEVIQEKSLNIKINAKQGLSIYADQSTVETILRNLIHNSIKFTPNEGTLTLSVETEDSYHNLIIKDTGVGMNQKILSNLFNQMPNKSQKGLNDQQGSGIGLVLVKELVEINKGDIKVESEINKGTTFYLKLPKGN